MYSNDPEIPHENGLKGANGCTFAVFTKGCVFCRRPDLGRCGCADRDFSTPAGYAAPSKGIAKTHPLSKTPLQLFPSLIANGDVLCFPVGAIFCTTGMTDCEGVLLRNVQRL